MPLQPHMTSDQFWGLTNPQQNTSAVQQSVDANNELLQSLDKDNWQDVLLNKAKNGDSAALDLWLQYVMSESSLQSAREYETKANSERYQTMVEDAKKAGINPYWVASLGSAPNYTGTGSSYSSNNYLTARQRSEQEKHNTMNEIIGLVKSILGFGSSIMSIFSD